MLTCGQVLGSQTKFTVKHDVETSVKFNLHCRKGLCAWLVDVANFYIAMMEKNDEKWMASRIKKIANDKLRI